MQARSHFGAVALLLACACGPLAACEESKAEPRDASEGTGGDASVDGGDPDAGGGSATIQEDARATDTGAAEASPGSDASEEDGGPDGGQGGGPADPLAPFALDCANLPSNGVCQGGPREVLLVTEESGVILMFDPTDGHFLGYFKRQAASYWDRGTGEYQFATQGPDQCIWTSSGDLGIERWNADGTFRDMPFKPHFVPVSGGPDRDVLQGAHTFAFTADEVFVNSTSGDPNQRVLAYKLDGTFDRIVHEDDLGILSLLVLGDGSLLIADGRRDRVVRIPAAGGAAIPVLGGVEWLGQISYAGGGELLVVESDLGRSPLYSVSIETMMARQIFPQSESSTNMWGVAALHNGKWLFTSGEFLVSALDPASTNPTGQHVPAWDEEADDRTGAIKSLNFRRIGRACLPTDLVQSRASKPANDTCIEPPDGPVLFSEDFESPGDFTGSGTGRHYNAFYDRGASGVTTILGPGPTDGVAENDTRTLQIFGAGTVGSGDDEQNWKTGLVATFAGGQPKYASYRVYVPAAVDDQSLGYLMMDNATVNTYQYDYLAAAFVYNGYARGGNSNAASEQPDKAGKWVRVELRDIDWTARTYDLYVDCQRVTEGVPLPAGFGDSIDRINLFNATLAPDDYTVAWYDDILIK